MKQIIEKKDINASVNEVDEEYNNTSRSNGGSNHVKRLNTLQTNGDNTSYGGYNSNNQLIRTSDKSSENDTSNNNNRDVIDGTNCNSQMKHRFTPNNTIIESTQTKSRLYRNNVTHIINNSAESKIKRKIALTLIQILIQQWKRLHNCEAIVSQ